MAAEADGIKMVVYYLPDVTHTHSQRQKLECGRFTDSGFGPTVLVVFGDIF